MLGHKGLEARHINRKTSLGAKQFREIDGEAIGVVEFKSEIS